MKIPLTFLVGMVIGGAIVAARQMSPAIVLTVALLFAVLLVLAEYSRGSAYIAERIAQICIKHARRERRRRIERDAAVCAVTVGLLEQKS